MSHPAMTLTASERVPSSTTRSATPVVACKDSTCRANGPCPMTKNRASAPALTRRTASKKFG